MDTLKMIEDREKDFSKLWERMDADRKMLLSSKAENKYKLVDSKGKPIPGTVSVTDNKAAVFVNAIASILMSAQFQFIVEGKIPPTTERIVETFIEANLEQADERLNRLGYTLHTFLSNHICARGYIGARWLSRMEGDQYIADCLPVDMRYTVYESGYDGLKWVATKSKLSKYQIEKEFGVPITDAKADVVDYWDDDKNEIYIDKKLAPDSEERKHTLGYPPFVIQMAPAGFMFRDDGFQEDEGESLLSLDRGLYSEWNRILSIEQTLNLSRILPPLQKQVKDMGGPEPEYPSGIGKTVEVLEGETWQPVPLSDLSNASIQARNDISTSIQQGGVNNIDLGNVNQQVSAVWITEQTEIRNKLLTPRINALQRFYELLAEMMIDQYKKGGYSSDVGIKGRKQTVSVSQLGDLSTYSVTCKLMTKSKKQEIANLAMAQASRGILSQKTILTDILVHDDPEGEIARMDAEKAEEAEPALFYFRKACSLADEADQLTGEDADQKRLESMMMTEKGVALISQGATPQVPKQEPNNNALVPLLGSAVRGG